jgi:hypothetical protein
VNRQRNQDGICLSAVILVAVDAMPSEAKKYLDYARECVRLAGYTETPEARDKLLELARVWMDAAMTEEQHAATRAPAEAATPARAGCQEDLGSHSRLV